MKDLARAFKALADETRLQMMALILCEGELCVCDCMQVLDISQSKASRHLRYLANAGLLDDRRETVWVYYRVASQLDADRSRLVKAVRQLFPPNRIADLRQRLEEWRKQKSQGCAPASG
ncbi:MAG: metalloregulator ArsR/SmtB family transcription factor [Deltaproteobacteria bacterium]|nr:metalloregulator ArsR/SmtB family transcription factor [Deltaproteobacteria bacterium]